MEILGFYFFLVQGDCGGKVCLCDSMWKDHVQCDMGMHIVTRTSEMKRHFFNLGGWEILDAKGAQAPFAGKGNQAPFAVMTEHCKRCYLQT